jgi:hypothetical protein
MNKPKYTKAGEIRDKILKCSQSSEIESAINEWRILFNDKSEGACVCYNTTTMRILYLGISGCKKAGIHSINPADKNSLLIEYLRTPVGKEAIEAEYLDLNMEIAFHHFLNVHNSKISYSYSIHNDEILDKDEEFYNVVHPMELFRAHIRDLIENFGFYSGVKYLEESSQKEIVENVEKEIVENVEKEIVEIVEKEIVENVEKEIVENVEKEIVEKEIEIDENIETGNDPLPIYPQIRDLAMCDLRDRIHSTLYALEEERRKNITELHLMMYKNKVDTESLRKRILKLKSGIEEYKRDFSIFRENLDNYILQVNSSMRSHIR